MNTRHKRTFFFVATALLALTVALYVWVPGQYGQQEGETVLERQSKVSADKFVEKYAAEYDWETSRANLEYLGSQIRAIRSQQKLKPVAEWKSVEDTGVSVDKISRLIAAMPEHMRFVESRKDILVKTVGKMTYATQYQVILGEAQRCLSDEELAGVWALRGEEFPIVMDNAMYSFAVRSRASRPYRVLVLRLSGEVDEIEVSYGKSSLGQERKDVFLKK